MDGFVEDALGKEGVWFGFGGDEFDIGPVEMFGLDAHDGQV